MNKWSTSLPSIISLCNNVQLTFDPMFMQQASTSPCRNQNGNAGNTHTDLSILIQTQPPFLNYNQYANNYEGTTKQDSSYYETAIEHETTIQTNITAHEQFVPDNELLQSLVAYADSFDLDNTVYSVQNSKTQPMTTSTSISTMQTIPSRRRTQSSTTHLTSMMENNPLARHRSCDDLSITCSITTSSKPTTVIRRNEQQEKNNYTKFVPSESHPQFYFATPNANHNSNKNNSNNVYEKSYEDKLIEEATSTTGGSKIEWGFSSDTMNELNKPATDVFTSYEATTNIGDINFNYLKDLEHVSSLAASMEFTPEMSTSFPPPPVIIRRKSKDVLLKQKVDIQLLRPPTPPAPAPIIIREVRHKSSSVSNKSMKIRQKLEDTGQIHLSKTPSPIVLRERPPAPPKHDYSSKPTIVYHHLPTPSPSPPTVIVERLRSKASTVIQKPPPILVEKWLPYPPEQKRKIIYERASPIPTRHKRRAHEPAKKIIVEYDDVNVILDRDIKQRKEIKRISPNEYVKQYGDTLYSNEALNQILSSSGSNCGAQVKREYPMFSHYNHYENYSPIFH
ncbi:unnamed protein product [Adineta ricciae]|uniref:Uncharacterized protein n=1 Tax=Adineta ricciae TaxID=249248 RepID=A0A814QUE1_ADIRI|nr:unnamed protein product [Adineta ricciae]CAF1122940.1 unnamed protein product [Adineta ricciae]